MIVFSLRIWYNKTNKNCVISVFFGSFLVGEAHSVARMGFKRPEVQILSPRPPRRSKVRFAPASFLLLAVASAAIKPPSPRSLAPPFPQKAPLGSPVRLQARSQRLAVATGLLRLPRLGGAGDGAERACRAGKTRATPEQALYRLPQLFSSHAQKMERMCATLLFYICFDGKFSGNVFSKQM